MNHELNVDAELLDSTLAHHLDLHLPTVAQLSDKDESPGRILSDTGAALYNLLRHYVDLLEGADHCGWTLDEEATVRASVAALSRAGWTQRLPYDISLEALTTPSYAPIPRDDRDRFVA